MLLVNPYQTFAERQLAGSAVCYDEAVEDEKRMGEKTKDSKKKEGAKIKNVYLE
jgi:hypothetical protein